MKRILFITLFLIAAATHAESRYTDKMFRRAMSRDNMAISGRMSTSALYVMITICDSKSGRDRTVCTTANLLSGAIHMEHRLDYDLTAERKEFEIATHTPARRFCFRSRKAAANLGIWYTPSTLEEVRRRLASMSSAQLRAEVNRQGTMQETPWWHKEKYQQAVAHVLLERGILVGQADYTGALFLDRNET
jgi:hypothetical protein